MPEKYELSRNRWVNTSSRPISFVRVLDSKSRCYSNTGGVVRAMRRISVSMSSIIGKIFRTKNPVLVLLIKEI